MTAVVELTFIPEFREAEGLVEYFEDLASAYWTGWNGPEPWQNVEGDLSLEAAWGGTGSATISVSLRSNAEGWRATLFLQICRRCGLVHQFSAGRGIWDFD